MYTVTEYNELEKASDAFSKGKDINLLVVVGSGGTGKTSTFVAGLKKNAKKYHIITGHITPKKLFEECYEHRDEIIVFDDVDGLLRSGTIIALLKQLCDTIPRKTLQYHTTQPMECPSFFKTSSKVALILNKVPLDNENVMAFLNRGIFINFIPTPQEIFRELTGFAKDKLVVEFIKKHIVTLSSLNFRVYKHAVEMKKVGLNWEKYLLEEFKLRSDEEVAIELTNSRKPYQERVALWKTMTGKSQSSYDRVVQNLADKVLVEPVEDVE